MTEYIKNNKNFLLYIIPLLLFIFYVAHLSASHDNFLWNLNQSSTIEVLVRKQPHMRSLECTTFLRKKNIFGEFHEIAFTKRAGAILAICNGDVIPLCSGATKQLSILEQSDFDRHFFSQLSLIGFAVQQYKIPKKITFHYTCKF